MHKLKNCRQISHCRHRRFCSS